jgi:hypothetical protein
MIPFKSFAIIASSVEVTMATRPAEMIFGQMAVGHVAETPYALTTRLLDTICKPGLR